MVHNAYSRVSSHTTNNQASSHNLGRNATELSNETLLPHAISVCLLEFNSYQKNRPSEYENKSDCVHKQWSLQFFIDNFKTFW